MAAQETRRGRARREGREKKRDYLTTISLVSPSRRGDCSGHGRRRQQQDEDGIGGGREEQPGGGAVPRRSEVIWRRRLACRVGPGGGFLLWARPQDAMDHERGGCLSVCLPATWSHGRTLLGVPDGGACGSWLLLMLDGRMLLMPGPSQPARGREARHKCPYKTWGRLGMTGMKEWVNGGGRECSGWQVAAEGGSSGRPMAPSNTASLLSTLWKQRHRDCKTARLSIPPARLGLQLGALAGWRKARKWKMDAGSEKWTPRPTAAAPPNDTTPMVPSSTNARMGGPSSVSSRETRGCRRWSSQWMLLRTKREPDPRGCIRWGAVGRRDLSCLVVVPGWPPEGFSPSASLVCTKP